MDVRQLLLEIRRVMRALTFSGTSTKVFGAAGDQFFVSWKVPLISLEQASENANHVSGHAWPGYSKRDTYDPSILDQEIHLRLYVSHAEDLTNDPREEDSFVGWRTATRPAGLLQVQREVLRSLEQLGRESGVNVQLISIRDEDLRAAPRGCSRMLGFHSRINSEPSYPPCRSLKGTVAGGTVTLTWVLPRGSRYDRNGLKIEYYSGASVPTSPGAGTDVPVGDQVTTVAVAMAAGQWSFGLWAEYDDDWPLDGVTDTYAARETVTVTV